MLAGTGFTALIAVLATSVMVHALPIVFAAAILLFIAIVLGGLCGALFDSPLNTESPSHKE